jgi:hypothetical protein
LEDRNKIVHLKDKDGKAVTTEISGSRTKLTINGKPAKRKELKVGMSCEIVYLGPGTEAKSASCN